MITLMHHAAVETSEGLDALLTIRCHARLLLIHRLLSSPKPPTRVLSILAGTTEEPVNESDLTLSDPKNYGYVLPCAAHSSTITSLSFEHLAKENPHTSFVHAYPGLVKTSALTNWIGNEWIRWLVDWTVVPLLQPPICVPIEEAGERGLFYLTSRRYAPLDADSAKAVGLVKGVEQGKGKGAYFVSRYGEEGEGKCMAGYRERGFEKDIWKHCLDVFEATLKKSV